MPVTLRRVLNRLPLPPRRGRQLYVPPSWHRPTQFDPCRSQPPFRVTRGLNTARFRRALHARRWLRWGWRGALIALVAWLVWESVQGLALF